jgi:uncharacterized membrane protein YedE/YeeE
VKRLAGVFVAGVIFAMGLGLSGMTNPNKVLGFLDVAGSWDPSLGFVMVGAIGVHVGVAQWALRARKPLWAPVFSLPHYTTIDTRLLAGAVIFGLGWGMAGFCPGPVLVDLVAPSAGVVTFVIAMLAGMFVARAGLRLRETQERARLSSPKRRGVTP